MIPRYRAWIKTENCFADYIESIRFYINEIDLCWGGICESDCFDFKDVILMQSTGLKDKNGKEVFVGDIIKCTRGCLHEVYIEKEYGGTYFGGMPAVYLKDLREGYAWTEHEEIIGNIWEDGDLIDGKKTSEN